MKDLNTLPKEVQHEVKSILKASYAEDHEFIGTYKAKEVYTEPERTINYVESFHDYPIWYKGKRDYKWLKNLTNNDRVIFDNNNLVTA